MAGSSFLRRKKSGDEAAPEREPFAPTLASVNLLPDSVRQGIAIRKLIRGTAALGVLLLIATAALWVLQGSSISAAQASLDDATRSNQALSLRLRALAPVQEMTTQIEQQQGLVNTILADQPQASMVLEHLLAAGAEAGGTPAVLFTNSSVVYTGIPKDPTKLNLCPNPAPFDTRITIGCITFDATAGSRDQIAALLAALEADPMFVGPYVTTSTIQSTEGVVGAPTRPALTFSGTVGVSAQALQTQLTPEQLKAITTPPAPSPSASATAGGS